MDWAIALLNPPPHSYPGHTSHTLHWASDCSVACGCRPIPADMKLFFWSFFFLMFNWRIIALQCCIDFCHRTISISYKYVYLCIYIHIYERVSLSVVSDPMDYNLPGSSVYGISQVRILEWVAIPLSRGFSQPRDGTQVCYIAGRFFTVWTIREAQKEGRQTPGVILMLWLTPPSWASLLPPPSGPLGHHRGQAGSLCYKAASHQLATLHLVVYTC